MIKYKLIKEYPDCGVPLGTIVIYKDDYYAQKRYTIPGVIGEIGKYKYDCQFYPEFWEKVDDIVIFTTEDNVKLYNKDTLVWGVCTKANWQTADRRPIGSIIKPIPKEKDPWKWFSTNVARNEYINNNKPIYSRKQILDIIGRDSYEFSDGECIDDLYDLITLKGG